MGGVDQGWRRRSGLSELSVDKRMSRRVLRVVTESRTAKVERKGDQGLEREPFRSSFCRHVVIENDDNGGRSHSLNVLQV